MSSFFLESCLFSVELSCVCYLMFYNLQCKGRAVTNVVRTCGPTPLLYYKEQYNMFKLNGWARVFTALKEALSTIKNVGELG